MLGNNWPHLRRWCRVTLSSNFCVPCSCFGGLRMPTPIPLRTPLPSPFLHYYQLPTRAVSGQHRLPNRLGTSKHLRVLTKVSHSPFSTPLSLACPWPSAARRAADNTVPRQIISRCYTYHARHERPKNRGLPLRTFASLFTLRYHQRFYIHT